MNTRTAAAFLWVAATLVLPVWAQSPASPGSAEAETTNLAKAVQNPVASLISVPIQNFTDFNIGPYARDKNTVLQFQPVIPMQLSSNVNLITRVIAPVISQPDITQRHLNTTGLGDINPSFFFSPAKPGKPSGALDPPSCSRPLPTTLSAPASSASDPVSSLWRSPVTGPWALSSTTSSLSQVPRAGPT
jgi:hypothetical protein